MDYEKLYKDALSRARNHKNNDGLTLEQYQTIDLLFPELAESEDEKIRKELIDAIQGLWDNDALPLPLTTKRKDAWISWLEKQGDDKPKWNEEDKTIIEDIIGYFQSEHDLTTDEEYIMDLDKYCRLLQRVKKAME